MVLPVLSPYAASLRGATGILTGMAIGAYGLTQAMLQIPFGSLSDRIGRKRTLVIGLALFALGSAIAAAAETIEALVLGRLVQGMGAIASVVVAFVADLTRAHVRTQAMARIGLWIGGAFALGMTAGPFLAAEVGVPALFWTSAVLSVGGAVHLLVAVGEPPREARRRLGERVGKDDLRFLLGRRSLLLLDLGTFLLHLTLTAIFVVVPFALEKHFGTGQMGKVVLPIVLLGLVAMAGAAKVSDRTGRSDRVFLVGSALFATACLVLGGFGESKTGIVTGLGVFVLAVACLEPVLPALTTRFATGPHLGAAMGVFHMSQFLGAFFGGILGGAALHRPLAAPFFTLGGCALLWLLATRIATQWNPGDDAS